MNIAVLQHNLRAALKTIGTSISTNPPILRYALLRTNSAVSCEIVTTDLTVTQIVEVPSKVEREFSCLVDYSTIAEVIGQMNHRERIDLTYDERESHISVVQGRNKNRLKCLSNISDFPVVPSIDDAEVLATIYDVRKFKEQVTHSAHFCTQPRKNYSTRATRPTEHIRLDIQLGEPLKIIGAGDLAASAAIVEADVQADADLTVFVPSKAFLKAISAMASDDTSASRTVRGQRFGVPFELLWLNSESTLVFQNSTRTILIHVEEKLPFSTPTYEVVANVPVMEHGKLRSLFKVAKRTRASSLTIRVSEEGSVKFEAAGTTVDLETGDWKSPYGEYLNVFATLELKGEAVEALEDAISFRRNPKSVDYDMVLFLARRVKDWLVGIRGNGVEDVIIVENADVEVNEDHESEMSAT